MNYDAASCSAVCSISGSTLTCSPTAFTGSPAVGAKVYLVSDFSTDTDYEAWGVSGGANFCCELDGTVDEFIIEGTDLSDTLSFSWDGIHYNLVPGGAADGYIYGEDSNDVINGSDSTDMSDSLYGGDAADTIKGHGGDDHIYGDDPADASAAGDDTLNGGPGDDDIYGGPGNDTINGHQGDDTIFGGDGPDFISGNDGDDTIDGGDGGDIICGGPDTNGDYLDDGDSTDEGLMGDRLWGGEDTDDTVICGNAGTRTEGNSTPSGPCTTDLTSAPAQCP